MSLFTAQGCDVVMVTDRGPVRLQDASVEQLLDVFQREGAQAQFNELFQARADATAALLMPREKAA